MYITEYNEKGQVVDMTVKSVKANYVKLYWQYYRSLEKRFLKTEEFVAFDEVNNKAYSFEFLSLLQTICSEIDVVAKAICRFWDKSFPEKEVTIQRWGFCLQKEFPNITSQTIAFRKEIMFIPWEKWMIEERRNKKGELYFAYSEKCGSPFWWNAYNSVKHARTTIDDGRVNYQKANLKNVMYSLGALYVLHRLMMLKIDENMYNFIEKSELFTILGNNDEITIKPFYDKEGHLYISYGDES